MIFLRGGPIFEVTPLPRTPLNSQRRRRTTTENEQSSRQDSYGTDVGGFLVVVVVRDVASQAKVGDFQHAVVSD